MKMRRWLFLLFFLFGFQEEVWATTEETNVEKMTKAQLEALPLETLEKEWNEWKKGYEQSMPELSDLSFVDLMHGSFSFQQMITLVVHLFFAEWVGQGKLLVVLITLLLLSALLKLLHQSFASNHIHPITYMCMFILLFVTVLESFKQTIQLVISSIDAMVSMMIAFVPLFLSLMLSTGQIVSATLFHPLLIFFLNFMSFSVQKLFVPLLLLASFFHLFSLLSSHTNTLKLAILIRQTVFTLLSVFFAIFLGMTSIRGAAASIGDGVALKTVKFMTGNFIPVLGKFFTEAADTVLSTSMLVKNTIGIAGLLFIVWILLFPVIKIGVIAIMYRVSSALLQPIGEVKMIECVDVAGKYILYFLVLLLFVSFLFFFLLSIMIISGNLFLMVK
ncbi:stage III sporulation protein AE [Massilibacterium senegalense]|uniref:stage III sporulation protein AE n=1 Tax=Massilibacterium senegalense TaxID=1632858 RepID=UPI000784E33D|nr:stage III sporulation protein AE [Massilibacterium senegalense]